MCKKITFILFYFLFFFILLFFFLFFMKFNWTFWHIITQLFVYYIFLFFLILVLLLLINLYFFFSIINTNYSFFLFSLNINFNQYFLYFLFPFFYIFLIITFFTLIYSMSYNLSELILFIFFILLIFVGGFGLFFSNSFIFFFIFYEFLLIPSFLILYNFAKTRKCLEAAYLMFFWTQFGAFILVFNFIYLFILFESFSFLLLPFYTISTFQSNIILFFFLIGFGVKFPIWPFYDWLPKAHVEASTNFSIFLSGVLVKFAFLGLFKCLFYCNLYYSITWIYIFLLIGLIDSSLKLYYQIDLKKLIAYATVVEMHWLTISLISGQTILWFVSFSMLISHAFLSSNFFLIIDSVTRRFTTRLLTEISSLNIIMPNLYLALLILIITFLGFPGSLFFLAECLFFSFLLDINIFITFLLLVILYFFVASCFFKNWFFLLFGYSYFFTNLYTLNDIDFKELIIFYFFTGIVFILGITNQFYFNF